MLCIKDSILLPTFGTALRQDKSDIRTDFRTLVENLSLINGTRVYNSFIRPDQTLLNTLLFPSGQNLRILYLSCVYPFLITLYLSCLYLFFITLYSSCLLLPLITIYLSCLYHTLITIYFSTSKVWLPLILGHPPR